MPVAKIYSLGKAGLYSNQHLAHVSAVGMIYFLSLHTGWLNGRDAVSAFI